MTRPSIRSLALVGLTLGIGLSHSARAQSHPPGAGPSYVLVPQSAKRVKVSLTLEVKAPKVLADEWSVYVPQLPELPGQIDVRSTLFPPGQTARDLSDAARPMLYVRIPSVGPQWRQNITARVDYEATLLERRLESRESGADAPDAPAVAPLDPRTRRLELASGHQFDSQAPRFRAWLAANDLRRAPDESEVDFARRAFLAVRKGITHYEGTKIERLASRVCEAGKSDYAGITAVYVAALRANGIPARALSGRMVINEGQPSKTSWPHAKVEFFVPRVGWVPADVAGAIRSNRSPEGLEFFGVDTAEFLTVHLDTDLVIDTYFGHKTHDWLPEPCWWVLGAGNFDGSKNGVTSTVEVEPLDLAEVLARRPVRPAAKKPAAKQSRPGR